MILFSAEFDFTLIGFYPTFDTYNGERYFNNLTIDHVALSLTPEHYKALGELFYKHQFLMQFYYAICIAKEAYPFKRIVLEEVLTLPLNDRERNIVFSYLNALTWIYLIKDETTGLIKIGRSDDPEHRLKTLIKQATLMPYENRFTLLFTWEDYPYIESVLHDTYKEERVRGEWFDLSPEAIKDIKDEYIKG